MANKNLILNNAKVVLVNQVYYSPVAILPAPSYQPIGTTYCFLARVDPWADEQNPSSPTEDQRYQKQVYKNIFVAKQIKSNQISPVLERIDWISGDTYDFYQDNVNMYEKDDNGFLVKKFYIRNRYDQVFKCLWNNNGGPSLNEPFFEPGTYGTNNIYSAADGYKWKYIYTIDIGTKTTFMDETWIPVPVGSNTPNSIETASGSGDIEVINVTNGGSGYDPANATISIAVTGDGLGAAGSAIVENGEIKNIVVTSVGSNYSYANVAIISELGGGATAIAPTSPMGGHGFDPISELGCSNVMYTCEFDGSENGVIPTDVQYHQIGLVVNPISVADNSFATGEIYKAYTDFVVAPGFGVYVSDELIQQYDTSGNLSFSATILSFDPATNVVHLINKSGTPTLNAPVFGSITKTVRTLLSVSEPEYLPTSGYLAYIENREGVQRSNDGIEQVKIVLGF